MEHDLFLFFCAAEEYTQYNAHVHHTWFPYFCKEHMKHMKINIMNRDVENFKHKQLHLSLISTTNHKYNKCTRRNKSRRAAGDVAEAACGPTEMLWSCIQQQRVKPACLCGSDAKTHWSTETLPQHQPPEATSKQHRWNLKT